MMDDLETFMAYEIVFNNGEYERTFLTKDPSEAHIKAIELMQDNQQITLHFKKYRTSKDPFWRRLQEIIS